MINVNADFEQGLALGLQSRELTRSGSGPHQIMHASWPILVALFHLGRLPELLPILDEHVAAFRTDPAIECQFVRDGPAIGAAALTVLGRDGDAREIAGLLGDPLADRPSASAALAGPLRHAQRRPGDRTHDLGGQGPRRTRTYGPQHTFALLEALAALEDWEKPQSRSCPKRAPRSPGMRCSRRWPIE